MMKHFLPSDLLGAARLTKSGQMTKATAALQRVLGGQGVAEAAKLPPLLRGLLDRLPRGGVAQPSPATTLGSTGPSGAQFLSLTFGNQAGSRPYKLYVPAGYHGQPVPLLVMLHGCTQSPDDFAAGTRMNEAAEAHACLVAYPAQTRSANPQKC
jgi:poly(3-hydroxybutyrate) depolymerase